MKEVLSAAGVPTARFATFDALETAAALDYLETLPGPWVIKTDGLAAGKGVLVARTLDEAREDVSAKLSGAAFGDAGRHIVIEEGMEGEECSLLVLCDGTQRRAARPRPGLQTHRRRRRRAQHGRHGRLRTDARRFRRRGGPHHGRRGPPPPRRAAPSRHRLPRRALRRPHADRRRGPRSSSTTCASATPRPRWCCRCWPRTPQSCSSPRPTGSSSAVGPPTFSGDAAVCVVMASQGYPEHPRTGDPIEGLDVGGPVDRRRRGRDRVPRRAHAATVPTGPSTRPAVACWASPR